MDLFMEEWTILSKRMLQSTHWASASSPSHQMDKEISLPSQAQSILLAPAK
jgi:hypothetical protein